MPIVLAILSVLCQVPGTCDVDWDIVMEQQDQKGSGVRFTRPDGTPIYVNPAAVAYVRKALEGEQGNATIVFSSGAKQSVDETVDEVIHGIHADKP